MKDFTIPSHVTSVSAQEYNALLAELEKTRQKLHFAEALVDNIPLPLFSKNAQGALCSVNKAYEEFFQVKKETVLAKDLHSLEYFNTEEQKKYHQDALTCARDLSCIHCERI